MRNYINAFGLNWNVVIYDDTHTEAGNFFTSMFGESLEDLMNRVKADNDLIQAGLPANWTAEFNYPTDPKKAYFLLDKNTIMRLLVTFPDQWYGDLSAVPDVQVFRNQVQDTPRYSGWKDDAGVFRKPPPSDKKGAKIDVSGAQKLVDAFLALEAYEKILRDSGRARDANIVQFALDQVNKNVWTITEAFDYLRQNRLI
jgi:hypothetical protein